jgi:hypothetical protein
VTERADQLSLLGGAVPLASLPPAVRPSDPETSHEAAAMPGRGSQRRRVLIALRVAGTAHDERLSLATGLLLGSASKRRGELVAEGLVEWTGTHTKTSRGARTRVWRLTTAGRQEADR